MSAQLSKSGNALSLVMGDETIPVSRVWGAVIWPGAAPGYAMVGAQAKDSGRVHLVAEHQESDWQELVRRLAESSKSMLVDRWLHEGGVIGEAFRDRSNRLCREELLTKATNWGGYETLPFSVAPHIDNPTYAVGLARGFIQGGRLLTQPEMQLFNLHLKATANLKPDQVLQEMASSLTAFRAFVFLVCAFDQWPTAASKYQPPEHRTRDKLTGV